MLGIQLSVLQILTATAQLSVVISLSQMTSRMRQAKGASLTNGDGQGAMGTAANQEAICHRFAQCTCTSQRGQPSSLGKTDVWLLYHTAHILTDNYLKLVRIEWCGWPQQAAGVGVVGGVPGHVAM